MHHRLVARRITAWQGRISDEAADYSLRMYELIFVAYLIGIASAVLFVVLIAAGLPVVAIAFVIAGLASGGALFGLATHFGRAAGHEIARQYGLPPGSWRRMTFKTPREFDQWLASRR
jgi:hypothetical protein